MGQYSKLCSLEKVFIIVYAFNLMLIHTYQCRDFFLFLWLVILSNYCISYVCRLFLIVGFLWTHSIKNQRDMNAIHYSNGWMKKAYHGGYIIPYWDFFIIKRFFSWFWWRSWTCGMNFRSRRNPFLPWIMDTLCKNR